MDATGGRKRLLTRLRDAQGSPVGELLRPQWSPDRRLILFFTWIPSAESKGLYVIDRDGSGLTHLERSDSEDHVRRTAW